MAQVRVKLRVVALLVLHAAALIQKASTIRTNGLEDRETGTGGATTGASSSMGRGLPGTQQRREMRAAPLKRMSGAPVPGQYIIIYNTGVDVVAASESSKAKLLAYAHQQVAAAASEGAASASATAAAAAIRVASVIQPRSSNVAGLAVVKVDPTWTLEQVSASLAGPEVKSVQPDTYVTLDPMDTSKFNRSSSSSSTAAGTPAVPPSSTAAGWTGRRNLPPGTLRSPSPSPSPPKIPPPIPPPQPIHCSGQFTAWTKCRLDHPPMWQSCTKYRTFVVNVSAANGGRSCRWQDRRVQWRACPREVCGGVPDPSGLSPLPVKAIEPPERAIWGMSRVDSYRKADKTVADIAAVAGLAPPRVNGVGSSSVPEGLFVAVVDTGIDRTHPDLVVAGIMDLVDKPGSAYYEKDGNGHGTHVSGIIGAKANGKWGVGVAPGMPIYAFKVLNQLGSGKMSDVVLAFNEILKLLEKGAKIAAINLSFVMNASSQFPPSNDEIESICGYVKQMAAYGAAVVVAAGNQEGMDLTYKLPGACPDALAVTAMMWDDTPAFFSNYAYANHPQWVYDTTMAAPGYNIWSTIPLALGMGPYLALDGTSAAAPFVSGGAALCVMAKGCKISSTANQYPAAQVNYPALQEAAKKQQCGKFKGFCGPDWGSLEWGVDAYYGFMLNVSVYRS